MEGQTGLSYPELITIYDTLINDGYIQHVYPAKGWEELRVGAITGQGRIFFEQGGYKDQRPLLDRLLHKIKDSKVFAWLLLTGIGFTSIWGIVEIVIKIVDLFHN